MAQTIPQFVIKKHEGFGGNFVDSQYLGALGETGKPEVLNHTMQKIFSAQNRFFTGKPFTALTGGKGASGRKEISTESFRWYLQGAEEKLARIVEPIDNGATPGINLMPFKIKLDLDFFAEPDVLMLEDASFPIEIVGDGIKDGLGTIYTVRLQGDDPTVFVPPHLLLPGKEVSKVWTSVSSEYNDIFGTQQAPSSFMLESQVGAFAQKLTITDKAMRTDGRFEVKFIMTDQRTGKENIVSKFLPVYEARMHDELYRSMEVQGIYGVRQTRPGNNGYWKKTGPGVRQILRDSWIDYINGPLTVTRLKDYLLNIFFSRVDEQDRNVVALTGTLGSLQFHEMLAAEAASLFTVDTHFISEVSKNPKKLAYGAQFTTYEGPEGMRVTLMKTPMYDSRQYDKRMHPQYVEFPVDSARMTFMDFGTSSGESNITQLTVKDTYRYGYVMGTVGPNGPVKGGQAGALKAGYDMFTEGTMGVHINDPSRCGELIPDIDY